MASFSSVLSAIGHGLKKFFGVAEEVAVAAEPFIGIVFPGVAPLFNSIVSEVGKAEAVALAAGSQNGTGAQKLALVTAAVEQEIAAYLALNNIKEPLSVQQTQAAINGVVAFLNALPAPPAS